MIPIHSVDLNGKFTLNEKKREINITSKGPNITRNYRQIWHPEWPMGIAVPSIVEVINEQNSLVNKCL